MKNSTLSHDTHDAHDTHNTRHTINTREDAVTEANQYIAMGVGVGGFGAGAALLLGAVCPICVVAAPGLIGLGLLKRHSAGKAAPANTVQEELSSEAVG